MSEKNEEKIHLTVETAQELDEANEIANMKKNRGGVVSFCTLSLS